MGGAANADPAISPANNIERIILNIFFVITPSIFLNITPLTTSHNKLTGIPTSQAAWYK
jgi:hypothetical protein